MRYIVYAASDEQAYSTYIRDYIWRITQAQLPWIIAATVLFFSIIFILAFMLMRFRNAKASMENLVDIRTHELSMQTAKLTTLFDSIPAFVFVKDENFRYTDVNQNMLRYFNLTASDVLGKTDEEGFNLPSYVAERFRDADRQTMNDNNFVTREEVVPMENDASAVFAITKAPLVVEGKAIGIVGVAHDISERKRLEAKLKDNYDQANRLSNALARITQSPSLYAGDLQAAVDYITTEGCYTFNVDEINIWRMSKDSSHLEYISRQVVMDYDQRPTRTLTLAKHPIYADLIKHERIIVMNTREMCESIFTPASDVYSRDMCAALEAPIRIDGKVVGVVCVEQHTCEKFPNHREWLVEEQNFVASLADLMALAIAAQQRHQAQEEAEAANRSKSIFLASMSHEIRTPMNAIMGINELIMQREGLPSDINNNLKKIHDSCDMLLGIINDILDFSKIEAGKMDIAHIPYDTADLISATAQLNMVRINDKPITFEMQIDEQLPARLVGDALRVKQVLSNLLSNAFKYTDKGKVSFIVTTEAGKTDEQIILVVTVRDTGVGMTESQVADLFNEYTRYTDDIDTNVEGTGLGMAITKRLLFYMHGEITVESEKGKGSVFTVRIPQEKVSDLVLGHEVVSNLQQFRTHSLKKTTQNKFEREPLPHGKVLVVDDVSTNLYVARGLLKLYQLQIETASSGREAIEKVKQGHIYDIIFMDHMMPEMDGIETTRQILALGYTGTIIALTANAVAGQDDIFLQSGFDDFISKPINVRRLDTVLMTYIPKGGK